MLQTNKYLKYKNKYLNLKKQFGGSADEFPKIVLDRMVDKECLQNHSIEFTPEHHEKLVNFFRKSKLNSNNMFLPNEFDETNYIGKTSFTKDDLKKIWIRLNDVPTSDDKTYKLIGPYYQNNDTFIEINDFIKIYNGYIEVNGERIDFINMDYLQIINDIIKKIVFKNKKIEFDEGQNSGLKDFNSWVIINKNLEQFKTTIEDFLGTENIKGQINLTDTFYYYNQDKKILILYRSNSEQITEFLMMFVKKEGDSYLLFPFNYTNLLLNNNFEPVIINLFEVIQNKLESLIPNDEYTKFKRYLIKKYLDGNEDRMDTELTMEQLIYGDKGIKIRFDLCRNNPNLKNTLGVSLRAGKWYVKPEAVKYETSCLFAKILNESKINTEPYYNILPDGFFHIHLTETSPKYILLTIHADREIVADGYINYNYETSKKYLLTRKKLSIDTLLSKKELLPMIKKHSFYLLFNLDSNDHSLYSFKSIDRGCYSSILFELNNTLGTSETIFGLNYMDLNHINGYGVIASRTNKNCSFFCNSPTDDSDDIEKYVYIDNTYSEDGFIHNNNVLFVTDGTMKCASAIKDGDKIFIDDILVNKKYSDCDLKKILPIQILTKYIKYAKDNEMNKVILDDDSFVQIPHEFYESSHAPHKWCYLYLFEYPKLPSIYLQRFKFKTQFSHEQWYINLYQHLKEKTDEWKREQCEMDDTLTLENINIFKLALKILKQIKDNSYDDNEYRKFAGLYSYFKNYIDAKMVEYWKTNYKTILSSPKIQDMICNSSYHNLQNFFDFITNKTTYEDIIKILGLTQFHLNKLDYDEWLHANMN